MKKAYLAVPGFVVVIVALLYWRVTGFDYVWDDLTLFVEDPTLREGVSLDGVARRILPGVAYFRPAVLLSFSIEFNTLGFSSSISHLINLFIFIMNTILVGVLTNLILSKRAQKTKAIAVGLSMAFYGLHPALVEPVAWVAGRFDLMVTFFCLTGLVFWLGRFGSLIKLTVCGGCFLLAALSKEMAVVYPLLGFFMVWAAYASSKSLKSYIICFFKSYWLLSVLIFLLGVLYLFARFTLQEGGQVGDPSYAGLDFFQRVAFVGYTLLFYMRLTLWPFSSMGAIHPFDAASLSGWEVIIGCACVFFYCAFVMWSVLRPGKIQLVSVAFLLSLLPVMNIIPLTVGGSIGHGRFLALPLAIFSISMSLLLIDFWGRTFGGKEKAFRVGVLSVIPLWIGFSILNINITLPLWSNSLTLWGWMYKENPSDNLSRFNYLSSLVRYGDIDTLGTELDKLEASEIGINGRDVLIYADYQREMGRYEDSLKSLFSYVSTIYAPHRDILALGYLIEDAEAVRDEVMWVGMLRYAFGIYSANYLALGRYQDALDSAITMRFYDGDKYGPTYLALARAYYALGDLEKGDWAFATAGRLFPAELSMDLKAMRKDYLTVLCADDHGREGAGSVCAP